MDMDREVQDLAGHAVGVLRERGWNKGQLHDEDGRLCLMGAVYEAQKELGTARQPSKSAVVKRLVTQLNRVIHAQYPHMCDGSALCSYMPRNTNVTRIEHWNDAHASSQDEVERILEKVAAG